MNYDLNTEDGMQNSVDWLNQHLRWLTDGGTWIIPRSGTAVTINRETNTMTITPGFQSDNSIALVARAAGWMVIEEIHELLGK